MKALVADDDHMSQIVVPKILSRYAEVDVCSDGSEAVLAFRNALERGAPYDLVCLDILMPAMSGLDALRLIRREEELRGRFRPCAAKIIITTATEDTNTVSEAFQGLCDAYLVKPVGAEELVSFLDCLFPLEERAV